MVALQRQNLRISLISIGRVAIRINDPDAVLVLFHTAVGIDRSRRTLAGQPNLRNYALALFSNRKPSVPGSLISVPRTVRSNANKVTTRPSEITSTNRSPSLVGPATTLTTAPLGRVIATRLPSITSSARVGFSSLNLLPVNKGFRIASDGQGCKLHPLALLGSRRARARTSVVTTDRRYNLLA